MRYRCGPLDGGPQPRHRPQVCRFPWSEASDRIVGNGGQGPRPVFSSERAAIHNRGVVSSPSLVEPPRFRLGFIAWSCSLPADTRNGKRFPGAPQGKGEGCPHQQSQLVGRIEDGLGTGRLGLGRGLLSCCRPGRVGDRSRVGCPRSRRDTRNLRRSPHRSAASSRGEWDGSGSVHLGVASSGQ